MLEAERQRTTHGYVDSWAAEFSRLTEDDAFATFLQVVCHYHDRYYIHIYIYIHCFLLSFAPFFPPSLSLSKTRDNGMDSNSFLKKGFAFQVAQ